MLILSIPAYL